MPQVSPMNWIFIIFILSLFILVNISNNKNSMMNHLIKNYKIISSKNKWMW